MSGRGLTTTWRECALFRNFIMEKAIAELNAKEFSEDQSGASSDEDDVGSEETRLMVARQNRKGKKSGGFQSMGMQFVLHKGRQLQ